MSKVDNAQQVRMIYLDTKQETIFKSVAYAHRVTGVNEYQIKQSLNPVNKKRFTHKDRIVVFRTIKP
jgi:hypothetical protein